MSWAGKNGCVNAEVNRCGLGSIALPMFLPVSPVFLVVVVFVSHFLAFLFRVSWLPNSL